MAWSSAVGGDRVSSVLPRAAMIVHLQYYDTAIFYLPRYSVTHTSITLWYVPMIINIIAVSDTGR